MSIHEGHRQRLKERYLREGLDHFEQHQVLELLLFYCVPRKDTNPIAHELLERFGTLDQVLEAPLPAVVSVTKTPFELRFPTVKKIFASNRAVIGVIAPQEMEGKIDLTRAGLKGSPTKVKKSFTPQHNKTCVLVEADYLSASAVKLVALLSDAKKF